MLNCLVTVLQYGITVLTGNHSAALRCHSALLCDTRIHCGVTVLHCDFTLLHCDVRVLHCGVTAFYCGVP